MRQMLLRVPDDVHRRLSARAARQGQSINAVANAILDAAVDADEGDRRARLRARAAASGMLVPIANGRAVGQSRRRRILASTKGTGEVLDQILGEARNVG